MQKIAGVCVAALIGCFLRQWFTSLLSHIVLNSSQPIYEVTINDSFVLLRHLNLITNEVAANLLGCFVMGFIFFWQPLTDQASWIKASIAVGFNGSLTTWASMHTSLFSQAKATSAMDGSYFTGLTFSLAITYAAYKLGQWAGGIVVTSVMQYSATHLRGAVLCNTICTPRAQSISAQLPSLQFYNDASLYGGKSIQEEEQSRSTKVEWIALGTSTGVILLALILGITLGARESQQWKTILAPVFVAPIGALLRMFICDFLNTAGGYGIPFGTILCNFLGTLLSASVVRVQTHHDLSANGVAGMAVLSGGIAGCLSTLSSFFNDIENIHVKSLYLKYDSATVFRSFLYATLTVMCSYVLVRLILGIS